MTTLDVDIPSKTVTGAISVTGATRARATTGRCSCEAPRATSRPSRSRTRIRTPPAWFPARTTSISNAGSGGDTTPMNTFIKLRCFAVP